MTMTMTMTNYRVFELGPNGRVEAWRAFVCDSDEHAIEWAKQLQDDRPVELWSHPGAKRRRRSLRNP
jgi:hypothetical protein